MHLAFDAGTDPVATLRAAGDAEVLASMRAAARTAVHAGITTVRDLGDRGYLDAGRTLLLHGHVSFMSRGPGEASLADIDAVVASGIAASLTLGVDRAAGRFDHDPGFARRVGFILNGYRELAQRGARVVLGTDAGIGPFKPHDVLPLAVAQLAALGVPAADALAAATSRAAAACGLSGRKGRIQPGADADFLAVAGDPGRDLAALRSVRAVFRAGVRVR